MDPITAAILAALATKLVGGATTMGSHLIGDAYQALKTALKNTFGKHSHLADALDRLEAEPDFEPNQMMLAGRVKQIKAEQDPVLMDLVKKLAEALESANEGKKVPVKYAIQANQIGVVGDHATIKDGLHFSK